MNGTPVTTKKKRNPAQLRRSKLRQEEFFRKKREAVDSGTQKSGGSLPDPVVGQQQLVVQLQGQQAQKVEGIPQLDWIVEERKNVENTATFTFISDYGDEDVKDSLNELMQDNLLPISSILISEY